MNSPYLRYFIQYLVSFFIVMILYDLGFSESIDWLKNILSSLVFALLMAYFKTRKG